MKIYKSNNRIGQLVSFEVSNTWLGRRGFVRVLKKIPNMTILRTPKVFLSWFREDDFCEFEINGKKFTVEEPFGDNDRYWVGEIPCARTSQELEIVANKFEKQRWPLGFGKN